MSFSCAYSSSILSPSPSRLELGSVFAQLLLTKPPVRRPKLIWGTETILIQMQCNVTFFFWKVARKTGAPMQNFSEQSGEETN